MVDLLVRRLKRPVAGGGRTVRGGDPRRRRIRAGRCVRKRRRCDPLRLSRRGATLANFKLAEMKLSDDGVPAIDSPLNNWGDMGIFPDCVNETDLNGNPRVMNGGVDAGAYEYDWRERYREDLGVRATSVAAADGFAEIDRIRGITGFKVIIK